MSYTFNPFDSSKALNIDQEGPSRLSKMNLPDAHGYEWVRSGEPDIQSVVHDEVRSDITRLLNHYNEYGYSDRIPGLENHGFMRLVHKFRATLDCWELIPISKVFSKDEIYYRCLDEGVSFTEFIKKARSTTLRGMTSLTETDIDEDYYFEDGYEGYDSIIHERNLIHWDDRKDVDDVKYAFMETHGNAYDFGEKFDTFLNSIKLSKDDFDLQIDAFKELKNTKMYDPVTRKTHLMREFWHEDMDLSAPYLAKRAVVLTEPGSTRDTGIGDGPTIAKVKIINKICRTILENCTHSSSARNEIATQRLLRVLERYVYLHLDFKKYGLAFPRVLMNIALMKIGERYNIDVSDLLIDNFFIDIDGTIFKTERGTMLGWVDCLNELCVHAILYDLSYTEGMKFDWIAFNDDVEISFYSHPESEAEKAEMVRDCVMGSFNVYDILISVSKTYASKGSIFLEKYTRFEEEYNLDMNKRQLACRPYARSLTTKVPWKSKMYFASAYVLWNNDDITNRCLSTLDIEFDERELSASLFCGGWVTSKSQRLDTGLNETDTDYLALGAQMQTIVLPEISCAPEVVSSQAEIGLHKQNILPKARSPDRGRDYFDMKDIVFDVNFEVQGSLDLFRLRYNLFKYRDERFAEVYNRVMSKCADMSAVFDPGGDHLGPSMHAG